MTDVDDAYYDLDSSNLFPHVEELNDKDEKEYRIVINLELFALYRVLTDIYNNLVDAKIPFDIRIRVILDDESNKGFSDPIVLYTSEKNLNKTCNLLSGILENYKGVLKKPNTLFTSNEELFGIVKGELTEDNRYQSAFDYAYRLIH